MNRPRPTALAALLASTLLTTAASAEVIYTGGVAIGDFPFDGELVGLSSDALTIGVYEPGTVDISGTSELTQSSIFNGFDHEGTINISGGSLSANGVYFGQFGVSGTASVSGGTLNAEILGYRGSLAISGTGAVISNFAVIGDGDPAATFVATVSGGSWINTNSNNSDPLYVSRQGSGTLTISGTGLVQSSTVLVAEQNASMGTINLNGGTLRAGQVDEGTGTGTVAFNGGKLQLSADQAALFSGFAPGRVTLSGAGGTIDTQGFTVATAQALTGDGALTKQGNGSLTLTGASTYAGTTAVTAGTLAIDGAVNGPGGLVTVANGATLGGSGKLYRDVSVGATGQISSLLKVFGQVTLGNQANVGDVSSGTITADAGQQLVIGNATGGTINTTAGTASIATLNGASLTTGNLGATVETLVSGNITTNGGALVARAGSFGGAISGGGGLTKAGPGTLTLTGASNYTGGTFVAGGLILVNNSIGSGLGTGEVAVGGGGTLGGGGIISGPTAIGSGGTLAPGNSPGLLTLGSSLTLAGGSTSVFEINGAGRGTTYDAIDVAGLTTYGGTLSLVFGSTIAGGTTLDLFGLGGGEVESFSAITASGDYTGAFVNNSGIWTLLNGGQTLTFTESSGDLLVTGVAVPEPSAAAALAGVGTLAFAALRRRRAK